MRLRSRSTKNIVAASFGIAIGLLAQSAHAIIVYGPNGRNIDAPTGIYANSGSQYVGYVGSYNNIGEFIINSCAWPVAPNWVLKATHTTGENPIGTTIYQDGVVHTVVESIVIKDAQGRDTDLSLQRVDTPFARYAPMYTGSSEVGKDLIVYSSGNGIKGNNILNPITGSLAGWEFGIEPDYARQNKLSWGLNSVNQVVDVTIGSTVTNTLYATFDKPTLDDGSANPLSKGDNEGTAGFGDSSGGVFINNNGEWQLAGLIWAIDSGIYYDQTSGSPGLGAIFDYRGFYVDDGNGGRELVSGPDPVGAGFYASRVSAYSSEINRILVVVPEAGTGTLLSLGALGLGLVATQVRRRKR